jgi:hypothetical protein
MKKIKVAVVAPVAGEYRYPNSDLLHPMLRKVTSKALYGGVTDGASICPITKIARQNTFEYISPLDFRFIILDNGTISFHKKDTGIDQDWHIRDSEAVNHSVIYENGTVQMIAGDIMFATDTPGTKVMFWPHPNSPMPNMMLGMMDIYNWLRAWHYTFFTTPNSNKEYVIKKGDPLAMVTFITPDMESVELVVTEPTPELERLARRESTKLYKIKDWFKTFTLAGKLRPTKVIPEDAKSYFGTFKE